MSPYAIYAIACVIGLLLIALAAVLASRRAHRWATEPQPPELTVIRGDNQ